MTQQNNEAFENWYINENGYKKSELELNERGEYKLLEARLDNKVWQAATQHSEREIAKLNAELGKLTAKYGIEWTKLQASNNKLREALERVTYRLKEVCDIDTHKITTKGDKSAIAESIEALASTPAQSLVEHDNEVIERCVKVCNESINTWHASRNIRALKGTS